MLVKLTIDFADSFLEVVNSKSDIKKLTADTLNLCRGIEKYDILEKYKKRKSLK